MGKTKVPFFMQKNMFYNIENKCQLFCKCRYKYVYLYINKNSKTMAKINLLNGDVLYTQESAKRVSEMLSLRMTEAHGYIVVTINAKPVYIMVSAIASFT